MSIQEPAGEHVRQVTSDKGNAKIDALILANIRLFSARSPAEISARIVALDKEWDIERLLDLIMSALALFGITLSFFLGPYSLILPVIMLSFFIWHAIQGWCPPIPLLRYLNVRTRSEIDREKYALKALRGDFEGLDDEKDPAAVANDRVQKR